MKETLLVIADDLTGANDTAVMFAEAGFNTVLKTKVSALAQMQSDDSSNFCFLTQELLEKRQRTDSKLQLVMLLQKWYWANLPQN